MQQTDKNLTIAISWWIDRSKPIRQWLNWCKSNLAFNTHFLLIDYYIISVKNMLSKLNGYITAKSIWMLAWGNLVLKGGHHLVLICYINNLYTTIIPILPTY